MRYLTAVAATASTALLAAVQAAPSAFDGQQQQHQLTFGSGITKAATNDFDNLLADTKGLTDVLTGNYGNVVSKGAKWVKQHINDPRCEWSMQSENRGTHCTLKRLRVECIR